MTAGATVVLLGGGAALAPIVFAEEAPRDYRGMLRVDAAVQRHVNAVLRQRGILKGESKYYLSTAHDARDEEQTLDAFEAALVSLPRS